MNRFHTTLVFGALIIALGILSALPLMFGLWNTNTGSPTNTTEGTIHERIAEQSIKVPEFDVAVTLSSGQAEFSIPAEDGVAYTTTGAVAVGDPVIEAPVYDANNTVVRKDVLVPLVVNGGGSGSFLYIVRFNDTQQGFVQKDYVFLGDRVQLDNITVAVAAPIMEKGSEYAIQVSTLDRKPSEPFTAEPTVKVSKVYQVVNNSFKK